MSAVFISHSSKDDSVAVELRTQLLRRGHSSIFLDFDPEHGIPAGRNWERELYTKLRACRAVIALCSQHFIASRWCFAEVTQARALGKPILPVRLDAAPLWPVLSDVQVIDFSAGPALAYQRIFDGLKTAGLDPTSLFDLEPGRPPYPGLLALEEQDAAVYFGRDEAIQDGLETLNRVLRIDGPRWLLILGASGSGKSSLVRAGLLPRLKRDPDHWLVVEPVRPMRQPFDEVALAFAALFKRVDTPRDWKSIRSALDQGKEEPDPTALFTIANDLRLAAGRREALVLLVVDQFEELLRSKDSAIATRFCRLLRRATEPPGNPFVVICTLRSDFLGELQDHPAMQGASYESLLLGRMGPAEFAQVIEGPARVAGLDLGPGLVQGIVGDTAENDALPLLAFTLRELWTHHADDRVLSLSEYRKLGGLSGSVAAAAAGTYDESTLSGEELRHLRQAFRALVRLSAEGQLAGQAARWADIPSDVHPILERFVQARLLVSQGDGAERTLEVAHEALFRSWTTLREWLEADRRLLIWRKQLHDDLTRWNGAGQDEGSLLRGRRLLEAEAWLADYGKELAGDERAFIQAGVTVRERDRATRERQRHRVLIGLGIACVFFLALAGMAAWQWYQADEQRTVAQERGRLALSRQLASQARALSNQRFDSSLLAALVGYRISESTDARSAVLDALVSQPRVRKLFRDSLPSAAFAATLSPDGAMILTAGCAHYQDNKVTCAKGVVQRWDARTGVQIGQRLTAHDDQISAVAFLSEGRRFATVSALDGTLVMWDSASLQPQPPIKVGGERKAFTAAFSDDGRLLAVGSHDGTVALWDLEQQTRRGSPALIFQNDETTVSSIAFSADGTYLAAGSTGGEVALIDVATGVQAVDVFRAHATWIDGVAIDPTRTRLATAGRDKKVKLWRLDRDRPVSPAVVLADESAVQFQLAWSPDGRVLAAAGEVGVRMWRMPDGQPLAHPVSALGTSIFGLVFDRNSRTLLGNGGQGLALLIDVDAGPNVGHQVETQLVDIQAIDFSGDGQRVALGGCAAREKAPTGYGVLLGPQAYELLPVSCDVGGIEIWELRGPRPSLTSRTTLGTHSISAVRFLSDSRRLRAAIGYENTLVSWDPGSNQPPSIQRLPQTVRGRRTHTFVGSDAATVAVAGCGRFRDDREIDCDEGRLELWDAERGVMTGGPWAVHREKVSAVAVDHSGAWMASGGDTDVIIWDRPRAVPTRPTLRSAMRDGNTGSEAIVSVLAFSADGRWLVGGTERGLVVWDFANRRPSFSISRGWGVSSLAFSRDSRRLAFNGASESGDAVVWDVLARTNAFPPFGPLSTRSDIVSMSPDGAWLVAADRRARVVVWRLSTEEPDVRACQVLGRSFTREDVAQLAAGEVIGELCPSAK